MWHFQCCIGNKSKMPPAVLTRITIQPAKFTSPYRSRSDIRYTSILFFPKAPIVVEKTQQRFFPPPVWKRTATHTFQRHHSSYISVPAKQGECSVPRTFVHTSQSTADIQIHEKFLQFRCEVSCPGSAQEPYVFPPGFLLSYSDPAKSDLGVVVLNFFRCSSFHSSNMPKEKKDP